MEIFKNLIESPDFDIEFEIDGNLVKATKEGDKINIEVVRPSLVEEFKDYIDNIDAEIFELASENYEALTGKPLKELDTKMVENKLTEQDVIEYKAVVRAVAIQRVRDLIEEFEMEDFI